MIRIENRSSDNQIYVNVCWGVPASCDFYTVEKSQNRYNLLYGAGMIVDHSANRPHTANLAYHEEKYQAHGIALSILKELEHLYPRDTIPRPGREREPMQASELPTPEPDYRPPYGQLNRMWRVAADNHIDYHAPIQEGPIEGYPCRGLGEFINNFRSHARLSHRDAPVRYDPSTRSYEALGRNRVPEADYYLAYGDFVAPLTTRPEVTEAENRG